MLLVISAATGFVAGPASTAFFLLVCAQQVTDISLTDGTTRTSINATYQALPSAMRAEVQTRVEGMGVPLSLGFVGLLLLAINALALDTVALVVISAAFTVLWLWLALAAYRGYRVNLQRTLTRREWDPVDLRLDDQSRGRIQVALVDPTLSTQERREHIAALASVRVPDDPALLLVELVEDPLERWRDRWLRACALHALATVAPGRARWAALRYVGAPDPVTAETAQWILATIPDAESAGPSGVR